MKTIILFVGIISTILKCADAFAPHTNQQIVNGNSLGKLQGNAYIIHNQPEPLKKERWSMAPIQTMSLFGLGGPEIAIVLVAAAFLLGPEKLAEFGKDAGKIAGELKEVPKEFQKGLAEGEAEAEAVKKRINNKKPENAEKDE